MNQWEKEFGISYPKCKMTGQCCKCVSPSTPGVELIKKASENNEFAKDFLSIFMPFNNIEEAKKENPVWVERCLEVSRRTGSKIFEKNLYFYHCRYISEDNKCLIWEDRPQLCRDYPETPFLLMAPGCAYEEWSQKCRGKYQNMQIELEYLKLQKKELENLKYQRKAIDLLARIKRINNKDCNLMLMVPSISLISPGRSWIKLY